MAKLNEFRKLSKPVSATIVRLGTRDAYYGRVKTPLRVKLHAINSAGDEMAPLTKLFNGVEIFDSNLLHVVAEIDGDIDSATWNFVHPCDKVREVNGIVFSQAVVDLRA